jgi:hypothetical protein
MLEAMVLPAEFDQSQIAAFAFVTDNVDLPRLVSGEWPRILTYLAVFASTMIWGLCVNHMAFPFQKLRISRRGEQAVREIGVHFARLSIRYSTCFITALVSLGVGFRDLAKNMGTIGALSLIVHFLFDVLRCYWTMREAGVTHRREQNREAARTWLRR